MLRLRQTYLGVSPQQTLCLVRRPQRSPPEPLGKCFLFRLPDEILAEILEYLAPNLGTYGGIDIRQSLGLPLVCRHWQRLYDPIFYRKISLGDPGRQKSVRTFKLATILLQRPHLRDYVRDISVHLYHTNHSTIRIIAGIVADCKATRKLLLHTGWPSPMLLIIRAAAGLSQLEFLQLAGHDSDLSLTMLLANFNSVTLKELCISHYTEGIDGDPGAPWRSIEELTRSTHCGFEAAFRCSRLPQVTTLRLSEPRAPPLVTQTLVQWPARLVYLSMTYLCHSKSAAEYTVGAVQRILDVHCESLQHVVLGLIPYFKDGIPNFAHFPHLVNLQLSQYNLKSEKPYTASAKMAAPSQRHLRIDFGTEDQHKEDSKDFGAAQVQWLEEFVTTLNNGSKGVISGKLERIFIDFNPGYLLWEDHDVEDTWPWDYLEQAVQGAAKCNVALKYSTPACTRWEWDRMITRKRKGLEWRPHDDDDDDDEEAPQEDND